LLNDNEGDEMIKWVKS